METFEQLQQIIAGLEMYTATTTLSPDEADGYILREDIYADMHMPPFNKAAVDGYACRTEDLGKDLDLLETVPAGSVPTKKVGPNQCIKIMTGAPVPEGAGTVFMIEEAAFPSPGKIKCTNLKSKKNVCYLGEDYRKGDVLLKKGCILRAEHLAVIAGAGYRAVTVAEKPRIGIIVTGSELVDYKEKPGDGKIRNSNAPQLLSLIRKTGLSASYYGIIPDDEQQLQSVFNEALKENEIVLFTGGAAVGDFDLVPGIISAEGLSTLWSRTGMKPGNPMSFAVGKGKYVFGLSGNPVSSFVQYEFLVKPVLFKLMGADYRPFRARVSMAADWSRKNASRFGVIPVRLNADGEAEELPFNGSAHISALAAADALMEVPAGLKEIRKGESIYVRPL